MKTNLSYRLGAWLVLTILFSVNATVLRAQDCKSYYFMTANSESQMTFYDASGKVTLVQTRKVSKVENTPAGVSSTVEVSMVNTKNESFGKASGVYKCEGGKLFADVKMSMPQTDNEKQPAPVAESHLTNSFIEYPSTFTEGMTLPDAQFNMEMNNSGMASSTEYTMKNRKIEGKEKVTSDAGSWDAYKITYDVSMKMKMGGIGIPFNMKVAEWFVPNFGVVKSETYSKKGKLRSSALLTKFKS